MTIDRAMNGDVAERDVAIVGAGQIRMVLTERSLRIGELTVEELREALVAAYNSDFGLRTVHWMSRFTDATRHAVTYRDRRDRLAGDAAHTHPPQGGQGLNTGMQDAVNLGWKLAGVVHGRSPHTLLDSYLDIHHDLNDSGDPVRRAHPFVGRRMPDLALDTARGSTRVFDLLHAAQPVLLNLGGPGRFELPSIPDRVRVVDATHRGRWEIPIIGTVEPVPVVLIRPDGHVAWAADDTTQPRTLTDGRFGRQRPGDIGHTGGPAMTSAPLDRYVMRFDRADQRHLAILGGKGANLGELSRIDGVRVPSGFCVTTIAFTQIVTDTPSVAEPIDRLTRLTSDDPAAIRTLSAEIRRSIQTAVVPADVTSQITDALGSLDDGTAYAVRSSATAEDLPTASFAGQHDSYLNIVGASAIMQRVRLCWASLFTERAVTYRIHNGFEHRRVGMAVVVQHMLKPQASGVMFTADPVTGNRTVTAVEATLGLGEALVSGLVTPDVWHVRDDEITGKEIAAKVLEIHAAGTGGTQQRTIESERQTLPALTDEQVIQLVQLGRRVEAHFGRPQDIEWCLVDDEFHIVQSRPITTLFPIPDVADDDHHVYLSVGHQQMMTDPMKPLGLSLWQLTSPAPTHVAGGRLFVDVTQRLTAPETRTGLLDLVGKTDPLTKDALETILARGDFVPSDPDGTPVAPLLGGPVLEIETDTDIVTELIEQNEASVAALRSAIAEKSGPELLEFILVDLVELKRLLFHPRSHQALMAGMNSTWWLVDRLGEWLGERDAADVLSQSAPRNVTAEMGLALLDVADVIRPHPDAVRFLADVDAVQGDEADFLDDLTRVDGGLEARDAIMAYLDHYGIRCAGEIDITRPRWSERPSALLPVILGNITNFEPGAARQRLQSGFDSAAGKERELLERLRELPDGDRKAGQTKQMIDRLRTFVGYREYPKYGMVSRYYIYKQALMAEASRLVHDRVLHSTEDIFYLTFQELHDVARTRHADAQHIEQRREAFGTYQSLTPPRVLTSDGEALTGTYRRDDLPEDALIGLAVSGGTVEGRARIVLDMADADLEPGDILVTAYTDPSWTPLFVAIAGLVTEVGGLMTHGAVIAREYGLPAIVGVDHATRRIRDGQHIRLNGTDGYVEILS